MIIYAYTKICMWMLIIAKNQRNNLNFHNRCMGKQILIFLYYRILFKNKKEKNISICNNMDESQKSRICNNMDESQKSQVKDIIHKKLHAAWFYICEILEKAKIWPQIIDCWCQGLRERTDYKTEWGNFQGDGNVYHPKCGGSYTSTYSYKNSSNCSLQMDEFHCM